MFLLFSLCLSVYIYSTTLSFLYNMNHFFQKIIVVCLLFIGITDVFSNAYASCPPAPTDMSTAWKGEGNALDSVGTNHGTLENGTTYTAGKVGQALSFDGVDDRMYIPDSSSLHFGSDDLTIALWVKVTSTGTVQSLMYKEGIAPNFPGVGLRIAPDNTLQGIAVDCGTGSCGFGSSRHVVHGATSVVDGTWHHAVFVKNGTLQKVFVDGLVDGSLNETSWNTDSTGPMYIGSDNGNLYPVNGAMDEIKLFHRALSDQEVQNMYLQESGSQCLISGASSTATSPINALNTGYTLNFTPSTPIPDGGQVVLTFPAQYSLSAITDADISATGTNIVNTSETIDTLNNTITSTLTTSGVVTSAVSYTIDTSPGITNPSNAGNYVVGISTYSSSHTLLDEGTAVTNISAAGIINAVVTEALLMTINTPTIQLHVDPAVNNGEDISQYTGITTVTNALNGYSIYGKLDNGNGQARLGTGTAYIASGTTENTFGFEALNAAYASNHVVTPDTSFSNNSSVISSHSSIIGFPNPTNAQEHTIYYDLNVDYTVPAGSYGGTITYTAIGSF